MKVTYIYHSGFLIELEHHILIFDYFDKELPLYDTSKSIYCFVSHRHADHFNKDIFQLFKNATFILSNDTRIKPDHNIHIVKKNQTYQIDNITITTLRSTDAGVAFIVECENKIIYHAGDLNWWHWRNRDKQFNDNQSYNYKKEMIKLSNFNIDIAMCTFDTDQGEDAYLGINELIKHTTIKTIFPMHFADDIEIMHHLFARSPLSNNPNIRLINHNNETFDI